jgi:hypothetical protein
MGLKVIVPRLSSYLMKLGKGLLSKVIVFLIFTLLSSKLSKSSI